MRTNSTKSLFSILGLFVVFVIGLAAPVAAQVVVDFDQTAGTGSNAFPFAAGYTNQKSQFVWSPANLNNQLGLVLEFGVQLISAGGNWPSVRIEMGESTLGMSTATPCTVTYDANYNVPSRPKTTVFNGALVNPSSVALSMWRVAMPTPVFYSGQNNLLVTIYVATAATVGNNVRYNTALPNYRVYVTNGGDAVSGAAATSFGLGASFKFLPNSTWTGATTTAWNTSTNWQGPLPGLTVATVVPASSAWTVPTNVPALANNAVVTTLTVNTGGSLNGGATGQVTVHAGLIFQTGSVFNPNGSTVIINPATPSTIPIPITLNGNSLHNLTIQHDTDVTDAFATNPASTLTVAAGKKLRFLGNANLSNITTIDNQGTIEFAGTGATTITLPALPMGAVIFKTAAATDVLTVGTAGGNVQLTGPVFSGSGSVIFTVNVDADTFDFTGDGIITVQGLLNTAVGVVVSGNGTYTVTGDVISPSTLSVPLGSAADILINGNLNSPGISYLGDGTLDIAGDFLVPSDTLTVMGSGTVTIQGDVSAMDLIVGGNASLAIGGDVQVGNAVDLGSVAGTVSVGGSLQTVLLGMFSGGNLDITGDLIVTGSADDTATGTFTVGGTLTFPDSGNTQTIRVAVHELEAGAILVQNSATVILKGRFAAAAIGSATPSLQVDQNCTLRLDPDAVIRVGTAGGEGFVNIDGTLLTVSTSTATPKISGNTGVDQQGHFAVTTTATVNIDGLWLENFGASASSYAVQFFANSNISTLNNFAVTGSEASVAVVQLATVNLPGSFQEFSVAGISPANIDASTVNGKIVSVGAGMNPSTPSLYGVGFETDPNNVLSWENAPPLTIINLSLAGATVTVAYADQLTSAGGNQPTLWALAVAPAWLSVNAVTGALTGTPGASDVGSHTVTVTASDRSLPPTIQTRSYTLLVQSLVTVPLEITSTKLDPAYEGLPYGNTLAAAGGIAPYTWALVAPNNTPPQGLAFSATAGELTGVAMAGTANLYPLTFRVTDDAGNSAELTLTLDVQGPFSAAPVRNDLLNDSADSGSCAVGAGSTGLWTMLAALAALLALTALSLRLRKE